MSKIKYYGLESHFNENVTFYKDVNIQGNLNYDSLTIRNLTVSEQSTLGVTTSTSLSAQNLSVSGIITGNLIGNVTATSVRDISGNVRAVPQNSQISAYILDLADVGKHISITTGGVRVNSDIFSAGDAVSIYNNSGSNQTITQGTSVTMYLVGTATTGNRTLAQRGVATILCVASNTFVIMGGGLT
jgi:hypothetical protein